MPLAYRSTAGGLEVTDRQTQWRVDQGICRSSKPFITADTELRRMNGRYASTHQPVG